MLAMIPATFGFHPEDSLVLVTIGPDGRPFQARVDLPEPDVLPAVCADLVVAALRAAGPLPPDRRGLRGLVLAYTDDELFAETAVDAMASALTGAAIEVLLALRVCDGRWHPMDADPWDPRVVEGVPYDIAGHELTSRSVFEGKVTYRNRAELVDSLATADPDLVEDVAAAHAALERWSGEHTARVTEARWAVDQVRAELGARATWSRAQSGWPAEQCARLLRALTDPDVRDVVWCEIDAANAGRHVVLWREVVRVSPTELVAPAAGLLAFAAWLAGDGALAWCAVERALDADPDHRLAQLVGQALEGAVPPGVWQPIDPRSLELHVG